MAVEKKKEEEDKPRDETPSRRDGVPAEVENRYLRGTCALIQDTGIKIGL